MDPVMVKHGQDIGEIMGWDETGENVYVLFLGTVIPELIPAGELISMEGKGNA